MQKDRTLWIAVCNLSPNPKDKLQDRSHDGNSLILQAGGP
jgi:hypothetical protein